VWFSADVHEEHLNYLAKLIEQAVQRGLQAHTVAQPPSMYLTKQDMAKLLQVTPRTIDNLMARGILPFVRLGRTVRFRLKDVEAHIESHCLVDPR
jgi:excisionase family DNA binding protein